MLGRITLVVGLVVCSYVLIMAWFVARPTIPTYESRISTSPTENYPIIHGNNYIMVDVVDNEFVRIR